MLKQPSLFPGLTRSGRTSSQGQVIVDGWSSEIGSGKWKVTIESEKKASSQGQVIGRMMKIKVERSGRTSYQDRWCVMADQVKVKVRVRWALLLHMWGRTLHSYTFFSSGIDLTGQKEQTEWVKKVNAESCVVSQQTNKKLWRCWAWLISIWQRCAGSPSVNLNVKPGLRDYPSSWIQCHIAYRGSLQMENLI